MISIHTPWLLPFLLAVPFMTVAAQPAVPVYDVVLANGRVMDPESGLDAVRNVGITDGRIAAVSEAKLQGHEVIDATGLVVAPGFVNLHAHGQNPESERFEAMDGVTTALDEELGAYPVAAWYNSREGNAILNYGISASHVGARLAVMDGIEVGHYVMNAGVVKDPHPDGYYRAATEGERAEIARRMIQGLEEGALGFGFGISYTPAATTDEIEFFFRLAASRHVPVFVHIRELGIPSVEEVIGAAERTGASLHIVHIGSSTTGDIDQALALIDQARSRGVDVTTEVYPYTAGSTLIQSAIFDPGWQQNLGASYSDLQWADTGERLTEASFERYRKQGGTVIVHSIPAATVEHALAHPGVLVSSDGMPFIGGKAHPRGAGTYARVLGLYVREMHTLTLMDALARMTYLPARRIESIAPQMRNKGRIRIGADADITVFDPDTVIDRATFEQPAQGSAGISYVLIGGTFVVRDGHLIEGARPGKPIRSRVTPQP